MVTPKYLTLPEASMIPSNPRQNRKLRKPFSQWMRLERTTRRNILHFVLVSGLCLHLLHLGLNNQSCKWMNWTKGVLCKTLIHSALPQLNVAQCQAAICKSEQTNIQVLHTPKAFIHHAVMPFCNVKLMLTAEVLYYAIYQIQCYNLLYNNNNYNHLYGAIAQPTQPVTRAPH